MDRARVLIVEDQPGVADALEVLLDVHEIPSAVARTPAAALDLVRSGAVGVVIQDMNFAADTASGAEGVSLFGRIRGRYPDLPVILLTAWTSLDAAVDLIKAGAADYLAKPWDDQRLVASVKNLIELGDVLVGGLLDIA